MPKEKKFDTQVLALCSTMEKKQLKERALKAGESLSRFLIKSGLSDRKELPTNEEKELFKDAIFQLRKVGTNLNQIAYALHATRRSGGQEPELASITTMLKETETIITQLKKLL